MNLNQFTDNGKYFMLALDHRSSFRKLINPVDPEHVTDEQVIELKRKIIQSVEDQMSGVLIDKDWGLKAYKKSSNPFLLPLEKSGYTDKNDERITEIEYSVDDLKIFGASGAKILLYFNPHLPSAKVQLHTAKNILRECKAQDFPLFLEIRVYKSDTGDEIGTELEELVLGSLEMLISEKIVPSVWKLEYPGSFEACKRVTSLVKNTPWILLTKGSSFEEFVAYLKQAQEAGCRGFLAGRALWQEVGLLEGSEKQNFLVNTLPERFRQITKVFSS